MHSYSITTSIVAALLQGILLRHNLIFIFFKFFGCVSPYDRRDSTSLANIKWILFSFLDSPTADGFLVHGAFVRLWPRLYSMETR